MNDGFTYREFAPSAAEGRTVLEYLAQRYTHSSEDVWRARLAAGEILLEGRRATAGDRLRSGQRLEWRRPPWEEPVVPRSYAVLFRDEHLLAVAKPRGLPSVPAGGFLTHTLLHLVRRHFPGATPMHRLGRGTSGVLLFARTREARRLVAAAWRDGQVEKTYRALVRGVPTGHRFSVDVPIGLVDHPRLGRVHAAAPVGRAALTHVRLLAAQGPNAIVEVQIPTGRPHQIRIHLAAAGHPLVGDPLYGEGGQPLAAPGLPGETGYWLHACSLRLPHPATGRRVDLECASPPALCAERHAIVH